MAARVSGGIVRTAPAPDMTHRIVCAATAADMAHWIIRAAPVADMANRIVRTAPMTDMANRIVRTTTCVSGTRTRERSRDGKRRNRKLDQTTHDLLPPIPVPLRNLTRTGGRDAYSPGHQIFIDLSAICSK
jgi:hypothetical protein